MRVFVTGSTGFVGTAVVEELISHKHEVLGLTRSEKGAAQLKSQGAESLMGTIEDPDVLKKGASECDAVIHLAFDHDFTNFEAVCAKDRAAISALGSGLVDSKGYNRALVVTSGTMMLKHGTLGDEDSQPDQSNPLGATRGMSEGVCLDFAKQGIRRSVVRLPPTTHGPGVSGFTGMLVGPAMQHGFSAYVGDGQNHWCAVHRKDAAKVYRLAAEKAKPGSIFHAVAEEKVTVKDIATAVGRELNLPAKSITPAQVAEHFTWFSFGPSADNTASSAKTRELLGWSPTEPTILEDVPAIVEFMKTYAH